MATCSPRRRCLNNPNVFCRYCRGCTLQSSRKGISEFVKCAYLAYFKIILDDQDKAWAPHIVCKQCVDNKQKRIESRSALVFQWSGVTRKTISMTATSVQSTQRELTGRTGIRWFIQISSLQLDQFNTAMKFMFQCLNACPNRNCLVLKKTKPPFCSLTLVKTLFQMSVFLLLHYRSFFLQENLMI